MECRRSDRWWMLCLPLAIALTSVASCRSPASPAPRAGDAALRESLPLVPLLAVEPSERANAGRARDLEALAGWLTGARIVGLGEGEHGTRTLHRLAHRIFADLATHEGFTVFAWEVDQAHAALLDDWVQGERDDLDSLLAGRWWTQKIFYGEALRELLVWMRQYNATAEVPVHFAGFDAKQPRLAVGEVLAAVAASSPQASDHLRTLYDKALAPGAYGMFPNVWGYTGTIEVPLPPSFVPRAVELIVPVAGDDIRHGSVGVTLRSLPAGPQAASWLWPEELSHGRSSLELRLEAGTEVEALELSLYHRGSGTVWFGPPGVTVAGEDATFSADLTGLEVRPLMSPALQVMDYEHYLVEQAPTGAGSLMVRADSALEEALAASVAAERHLTEALDGVARLDDEDRIRALQLARLVTQAVQWRTLEVPNRDLFLTENLRWLAETAYPGSRIVAFGHTSHTERRSGRMGSFLAESLAETYRSVSLLPGAGDYLYFGDVAILEADPPLEAFTIDAKGHEGLHRSLAELDRGSFALNLEEIAATEQGRDWLSAAGVAANAAPDVVVFVEHVEPLRLAPQEAH